MKKSILIATLVLGLVSIGLADVIDPSLCTSTIDPAADGASVYNVPDGSGAPFTSAYAPGGAIVDATITLTVISTMGLPIQGYPAADMWLESSAFNLTFCPGGTQPDGDTDINGQTFWTSPMLAGGSTMGEVLFVYISGSPLPNGGVNLICNSPDFNSDLIVDLSDIVAFTQILGGTYSYAGDFNYDGIVDLSDIVFFAQAIGAACP